MKQICVAVVLAACLPLGRAAAAPGDEDDDSIPDAQEVGDSDADGIPDYVDADDDNDLLLTLAELGYAKNAGDTDGDTLPDYLDRDDDGDGLETMQELGDGFAPRNSDADSLFDHLDPDDDDDGEPTIVERKFAPPEPDVNHNGVIDHLDPSAFGSQPDPACALPDLTPAGLPKCWNTDHDGDGIWTAFEGAPSFVLDTDGDGTRDFQDADDDGDGLPSVAEEGDPDHDGDPQDAQRSGSHAVADYLNPDDDDDSVSTRGERPNGQNRDTDMDGQPDHLDADDDGDGVDTVIEVAGSGGLTRDTNMNGVPDYLDRDVLFTRDDAGGVPTGTETPDNGTGEGNNFVDAGVPDASVSDASVSDAGGAGGKADAGAEDGGAGGKADAGERDAGDEGITDAGDHDDEDDAGEVEEPAISGKGSDCSLSRSHSENLLVQLAGLVCAATIVLRRRTRRS